MFETIAEVRDVSIARVLIAALKAHGFNPMEGALGFSAIPGITNLKGTIAIKVPQHEANDAKILANDLLKNMES